MKDSRVAMAEVLSEARQIASGAASLGALQQAIAESIASRLSYYNWTGFYMLDPADPEMLVVGPYVGEPTPHIRIPLNEGICGAAAASGQTIVVGDVNADPRYLSCSLKTKSEIVVPIRANGAVVGEIDVDSHEPAAFSQADREFLEEVAGIVGRWMDRNSSRAR